MHTAHTYAQQHCDRFIEELCAFLRIPSVGTAPAYRQSTLQAAQFLKECFVKAGADQVRCIQTKGYPLVYAEKRVGEHLPTVLVYGHYDVQPADPYDLWDAPPFEPCLRDGKIYARGASDDKGQVYMHVKALEAMVATRALPCNLKFLIEGEEEDGSASLMNFLAQPENQRLLQCDVVLISDTALISLDQPSVTVGLRGISYAEVEVVGPARDLHSGAYGGIVQNPIHALSHMIDALHDAQGRITIPGFYNDVQPISEQEKHETAQEVFDQEAQRRALDIPAWYGESGYNLTERLGWRPSLDVNGIWGGYTAEGSKTVLPSRAFAKVSMRLVPNQQAKHVARAFSKYLCDLAPTGVRVRVRMLHEGENAVVVPSDMVGLRAACKAFEQVWHKTPSLTRCGGSIPVVSRFSQCLQRDIVLMGFALNSDNVHAPNEHFHVASFHKGLETVLCFYEQLAKQHSTSNLV